MGNSGRDKSNTKFCLLESGPPYGGIFDGIDVSMDKRAGAFLFKKTKKYCLIQDSNLTFFGKGLNRCTMARNQLQLEGSLFLTGDGI
jgi:hypothetical protein